MFYKICKFESSTITNDVIMTSSPKTMAKFGPLQNKPNYVLFETYWWELSINVLFIEFGPTCQTLWAFCQILAFLTMPAHQIWSCHVTQEANFEKFLFCPSSTFNIRKSHKISGGKALYFRSYQPKTSRGGGDTPSVPLGLTIKNWALRFYF